MFRPNQYCEVASLGSADVYGKRKYGPWRRVPFAQVKLVESASKTSVRTDSSATRGSANEILADTRFLFLPNVVLKPGDIVRAHGQTFTVVSVFPRVSVTGVHDHWQVDCNIYWG